MGVFLQDTIVYQVHFPDDDLIIGCREQELIAGDAPGWRALFNTVIGSVRVAVWLSVVKWWCRRAAWAA